MHAFSGRSGWSGSCILTTLADRPFHRSSQWWVVPGVPADHRLADGPWVRTEAVSHLPEAVGAGAGCRTCLAVTLAEIAIITRAAPARILGLAKGHLGPGADADVTIYDPDDDKRRMFALPRYVIKAGEVVVDDGELKAAPPGSTLLVAPDVDPTSRRELESWFLNEASVHPLNFRVGQDEVSRPLVVDGAGMNPQRSTGCEVGSWSLTA